MKKTNLLFSVVVLAGFLFFDTLLSNPAIARHVSPGYVSGELLVRFRSDNRRSAMANFRLQHGMRHIRRLRGQAVDQIRLPENMTVPEAIALLKKDPDVAYVEPNYYRYALSREPDDNLFEQLWGLDNTGQFINNARGIADADIDGPEAWDIITDCSDTVIAIIDSGVDTEHPDLQNVLWTNPGEIPGDNIDNDNNGYVDDIHGWNFIEDNNDIVDSNYHGSHIAGIIAAEGNNQFGITGVCWKGRIMVLKFLDALGMGSVENEIEAIAYAVDNGARIINASFGDTSYSASESNAVAEAQNSDILFVASAGNNGQDNDITENAIYPASYSHQNIIAVAMTNQSDNLDAGSNRGKVAVDIAAPGINIIGPNGHVEIDQGAEDFESNIAFKGWELEAPWDWLYPVTDFNDQTYHGKGALTSLSTTVGAGDATATSPRMNFSAYRNIMIFFYFKKLNAGNAGTLFVETSANGLQWASQTIYVDNDGDLETYPAGIETITSKWRKAFIVSDNLDAARTGYYRFRVRSEIGIVTSGWTIDDISMEVLPAYYSGTEIQYYSYLDGTSAAAPFVTGIAGLIRSYQPTLKYCQVKTAIMEGGDALGSLNGTCVSGRRANAYGSLMLAAEPSLLPDDCETATYTSVTASDDDSGPCFILSTL